MSFCFSEEIAKRVESFRNLSKNHDNPLELLVNYCVLVDCEVKDEMRKSEALRRELNLIKSGGGVSTEATPPPFVSTSTQIKPNASNQGC